MMSMNANTETMGREEIRALYSLACDLAAEVDAAALESTEAAERLTRECLDAAGATSPQRDALATLARDAAREGLTGADAAYHVEQALLAALRAAGG